MTPEQIVSRFGEIARPIMRKYLPVRSCIESTRVTIECLSRFGIKAEPAPVLFTVYMPERKLMYLSGIEGEEKADARRKAETWMDLPSETEGWPSHLVAVAEKRWLIDAAFDQSLDAFAETGKYFGPKADYRVLVIDVHQFQHEGIPPGFYFKLGAQTSDGAGLELQYRANDNETYRQTSAWDLLPLRPLVREICKELAR